MANGQQNKDLLEKVFDDCNAIALYLDRFGNIFLCNKKTEELTGVTRETLIGKHWFGALCPDSSMEIKQQLFKAVVDDSFNYKRPNIFEGTLTDRTKNDLAISWNISPLLNANDEMEGVLLLGSDITLLQERETSMQNIDATLKNIISNIKEFALYAINLEGNITYYGMGAELMFGWKRDEIIFKHVSMIHAYDDVAYKLPFILEQVMQQGEYELETFLIKKDGTSFPVILNVSKFISSDTILGYIFMAKDITEQKRLEYQIFQSEKMAAVGQLAAGMSHEINNPLFVISGKINLLLANKRFGNKLKSDLKAIETQAQRIRSLVDRVLVFARKTPPQAVDLDINKVIKNVLPLLAYHKLPSHKIHIIKYFSDNLLLIRGDIHQLQEIFLNLFINACQAMEKGGTLTIKTNRLDDTFAEITISDTGNGIAPINLKNMFMPFFSTKKDGTGLGLSICYSIIKNHNGTIDVRSQLNQGTTFIIKLPFIKKGG
ncbi:MAG: PAS domain S-box protein [Candidatus Omnitrophica bacterium]|nr:PAS domain S-box protein [Candidatus Omnitrophota bacterium]